MEKDKILEQREEYVCELFEDKRGAKSMSHKQSGLPIMEDEVVCALKGMAKEGSRT